MGSSLTESFPSDTRKANKPVIERICRLSVLLLKTTMNLGLCVLLLGVEQKEESWDLVGHRLGGCHPAARIGSCSPAWYPSQPPSTPAAQAGPLDQNQGARTNLGRVCFGGVHSLTS